MVFALFSLTPILLASGLIGAYIVSLHRRYLWLLLGLVGNHVLCTLAKKIIAQPRPFGSSRHDHGMPSAHASFVTFFFLFVVYRCWRREEYPPRELVGSVALLAATSASRVYLGYHTVQQIIGGMLFGVCSFALWIVAYIYMERQAELQNVKKKQKQTWYLLLRICPLF